MNETVPLNQPKPGGKAAATRERIRDAANELFIARGYEETIVDEIVAKAGVSKGTFYLYFRKKEDLLMEYATRRTRRLEARLPQLLAMSRFDDALADVVDISLRGKDWWNRDVAKLAIESLDQGTQDFEAVSRGLLVPLVELGQKRGQVRSDVETAVLARFIVRTLLGTIRDWSETELVDSRDDALDDAVRLILAATAAQA